MRWSTAFVVGDRPGVAEGGYNEMWRAPGSANLLGPHRPYVSPGLVFPGKRTRLARTKSFLVCGCSGLLLSLSATAAKSADPPLAGAGATPSASIMLDSEATDEAMLESASSLALVIRYALSVNPSIRVAESAWHAAQARIGQQNAYENPMVTYTPDVGRLAETRAGATGNGVEISQAIPFPGKLTLRGRVASSLAESTHEYFRSAVQEVSRQARARYADYFLASFSVDINATTTLLAQEFADIAAAKYRVGTAAQQDVILAQEQISRLAAERVIFLRDLEASRGAINTLLDRSPRAKLGAPSILSTEGLSVPLETLLAAADKHRPELRGQDRRVDARRHSLTLAKMSYVPDLKLSGQYVDIKGGSNPGFARDGRDIYTLKLGFSVPLWFNRVRAENAEARSRLIEEKARRRDLSNIVNDEIQKSYENVRAASRTEEIYRTTLIPQTQERIAAATSGYQTGEVDFLTLIDSLQSLEEVELERARSIRSYHRSTADLERAVGVSLSELVR